MVDGNSLLESDELEDLRYELFGEVLACEADYRKYQLAIRKLAGLYRSEGIDMLLLKGYGLSLNYPVPEHRPSGDIDIISMERADWVTHWCRSISAVR